jgi:hypothetical protein
MTIEHIAQWHQKARPSISNKSFNVQLGCHFEEVAEMVEALLIHGNDDARAVASTTLNSLQTLALGLKTGIYQANITNRKDFADAIGDQIVTAVGAGYNANMDVPEIAKRVDESNWSKFHDGKAIFDANGKVAKNLATYKEADLTGTY